MSVVPSLFEPFGIVALEAMAAQSPVVASDTGGLSEIIEHDVTGVKVYPNNPDSLAWGITKVLARRRLSPKPYGTTLISGCRKNTIGTKSPYKPSASTRAF